MRTRTQIPECLVSTEDNDARKRKPTKDGKNEGDDTSPQQAKRHQRAMGTVQEQAIETILLLRHVHWVRPYESAMWSTSPYRSALASGHQTALHRWVQHDRWAHRPSSDLDVGDAALGDGRSDEFLPSLIKARMREAVPWMAFCMFLQRWCIFGFGLTCCWGNCWCQVGSGFKRRLS